MDKEYFNANFYFCHSSRLNNNLNTPNSLHMVQIVFGLIINLSVGMINSDFAPSQCRRSIAREYSKGKYQAVYRWCCLLKHVRCKCFTTWLLLARIRSLSCVRTTYFVFTHPYTHMLESYAKMCVNVYRIMSKTLLDSFKAKTDNTKTVWGFTQPQRASI